VPSGLPAISGNELIGVLVSKDGWQTGRQARHRLTLRKTVGTRTLVTFIPTKNDSLPNGTLHAIMKQTRLRRDELLGLLGK
jgi:predicted RNA binding protein YcfA (HicA-like mRNA interferase family)